MNKPTGKALAVAGIGLLLVVSMLTMGALAARPSAAQETPGLPLFAQPQGQVVLTAPARPAYLRSRVAAADLELLQQVREYPGHSSTNGQLITLNLFEDLSLRAVYSRMDLRSAESYTWFGTLEGIDHSTVVLTVEQGILVGSISSPQGVYQVNYGGEGVAVISEIDQRASREEMKPLPMEIPAAVLEGKEYPLAPGTQPDDGGTIDVMVLYTPLAAQDNGGAAAVEVLIQNAVDLANASYANSQIAQRLRLVHRAQTNYVESGDIFDDLQRLRIPGDGYMDETQGLREAYKADIVNLFRSGGAWFCGVAYQMETLSPWEEAFAYSVTDAGFNCGEASKVFTHELGHNMGANHDWYVTDGTLPYTYAHGYVDLEGKWQTMMSYYYECFDQGYSCAELPYWSNPDVLYGGRPMGIPEGTNANCVPNQHPNCDADNHKVLNNTAYTVANFRQSGDPPVPTATPTLVPTPTPVRGRMVMPLSVRHATPQPTPTPTQWVIPTELSAVGDTQVLQGFASTNFGLIPDLKVGYDEEYNPDGMISRGLLQFSTAGIPDSASIQTAALQVYLVYSFDDPGTSRTITAYRPASAWTEGSVNWNSAPAPAEAYGSVSVPHNASGWYSLDVTALVQGWVNGSIANTGIMLRGPEGGGADASWRAFSSREGDQTPVIVISYNGAR